MKRHRLPTPPPTWRRSGPEREHPQHPAQDRVIETVEVTWAPVRRSFVAAVAGSLLYLALIFGVTQEWIRKKNRWEGVIPAEDAPLMVALALAVLGWSAFVMVAEFGSAKRTPDGRATVFSPLGRVLGALVYAAVVTSMTLLVPLLPDFPDDGTAQSSWHEPAVALLGFLGVATLTLLNGGAAVLLTMIRVWAMVAAAFVLFVLSPLAAWLVLMRPLGMPVVDAVSYLPLAAVSMLLALGWCLGAGLAARRG